MWDSVSNSDQRTDAIFLFILLDYIVRATSCIRKLQVTQITEVLKFCFSDASVVWLEFYLLSHLKHLVLLVHLVVSRNCLPDKLYRKWAKKINLLLYSVKREYVLIKYDYDTCRRLVSFLCQYDPLYFR